MAQVVLDKVKKQFGGFEAIHGVDLEVENGTFCVLVGPSGCGKSTLLRMIAGLEEISDGTIGIGGRVVNDMPPKKRDIAMVFQSYALYPHKTVGENMGFSLMLARRPKAEINAAVAHAAGILGLETLLDRKPKQLSGGQRQRVAMGRAIVRNPQVFLFDEPLSNLDAKLRVQMRAEIKELHARLGATTIYVTHDQVEAMTMADKIVVMRAGRVEQVGAPLDLYDRPANLFVASFIGSPAMNFLDGSVAEGAFRLTRGGTVALPAPARKGDAILGLRPEHLSLCAPDAGGALSGRVLLVETTGTDTMVLVEGSDGGRLTVLVHSRLRLRAGDPVGVLPETAHVHLFETEDRGGGRLAT